jgi:hypothetical protein
MCHFANQVAQDFQDYLAWAWLMPRISGEARPIRGCPANGRSAASHQSVRQPSAETSIRTRSLSDGKADRGGRVAGCRLHRLRFSSSQTKRFANVQSWRCLDNTRRPVLNKSSRPKPRRCVASDCPRLMLFRMSIPGEKSRRLPAIQSAWQQTARCECSPAFVEEGENHAQHSRPHWTSPSWRIRCKCRYSRHNHDRTVGEGLRAGVLSGEGRAGTARWWRGDAPGLVDLPRHVRVRRDQPRSPTWRAWQIAPIWRRRSALR